ncbi:MAG TPA: 50S ribosomal protein L6, partial [Blastocatellia bacterium]|nr:50S ribosomal protein L6 [Blastocatellia bacterium]
TGVSKGFTTEMDVVGVGYKAELKGRSILFALGYSHPIEFVLPEGVTAKVEKAARTINQYQTTITLSGIDKHLLGQTAANMHKLRKPDAYKGKGVRYAKRPMKLKPGKTGK